MIFENIKLAFSAIRANKMRSFLTMLGMIIGISSVIAIVSLGDTMRSMFAKEYENVGVGLAYVYIITEDGYYTENAGSITSVFSRKRLQWLTAHEERIAFLKEHGYEKLLSQAYRKLCDACITFYFRCTDDVEDAVQIRKELKERLKRYRLEGAQWIAELPFQTKAGYQLFEVSPSSYAKVLKKMQESV